MHDVFGLDVQVMLEVGAKHRQAEVAAPGFVLPQQPDAGRQHAHARKQARAVVDHAVFVGQAGDVAHHVRALAREQPERRVVPPLRLEDRAQQEGTQVDPHAGGLRQGGDPLNRQIAATARSSRVLRRKRWRDGAGNAPVAACY
ncbi:hypothetical protein G6F57_022026 [Rhizopus arrhizus]|nr:hypothetical protein G6F57_022026 [Rhizopus arrhizus]